MAKQKTTEIIYLGLAQGHTKNAMNVFVIGLSRANVLSQNLNEGP